MIPITVKEAVETSTAKSICYLRFNVKGAGLWEFAVSYPVGQENSDSTAADEFRSQNDVGNIPISRRRVPKHAHCRPVISDSLSRAAFSRPAQEAERGQMPDADPVDKAVAKIMQDMHDNDIETVHRMANSNLLGNDRILID